MAEAFEPPQATVPHHPSVSSESISTDIMPQWPQASCRERLRIFGYNIVIYTPVAILMLLLVGMPVVYFLLYFLPMVVSGEDRPELYYWHSGGEHARARIVGSTCLGLELLFMLLLAWSFYQAFMTAPGSVPDTPEWTDLQAAEQTRAHLLHEKKHTNGAVRWCRRCGIVKPDRSHHCRLCDMCVLKMDHHCPWIANCVGFYNYKYFFLMLTYGMLALWVFEGTFWETVLIALRDDDTGTGFTFFVTVVYSLMLILALAVTLFWCFHIYLLMNAATTIEFCEKHRKLPRLRDEKFSYYTSFYESLLCSLGRRPAYWLLPFHYRDSEETGLYFQHTLKDETES